MNINTTISISTGVLDTDGNEISLAGSASVDMLLNPFYATENDILSIVMDEPSQEYSTRIREIIFNSSVMADDKITASMIIESGMTTVQAFRIKRQYVICLSAYEFSKAFYRDYLRSIKKSKFLGDVKVSLDIEKDPSFIMQISADAKECFESIETAMGVGVGMASFVKGRNNSCGKTSSREWYPNIGNGSPRVPIAANKAVGFCNKYKIGVA